LLWRQIRPHLLAGLASGVLSLIAYALVLWAQTRGALAPIAALRETSVIIGAVIGAVVFGERFGRWRVAATVLVAGGVILVTL
jgi:drug/metabolite transporter (DMT)-like permease